MPGKITFLLSRENASKDKIRRRSGEPHKIGQHG